MIVSFLGPETSYTHLAAMKQFGDKQKFSPKKSIAEIFESVEKGESEFGVVPIENSTEGSIAHTLDSFFDSNLKIVEEIVLPISHCLLSNSKKNEIKKIYAHPQAFGQCRKYLKTNFPTVQLIEAYSNASGAVLASKETGSAAIASDMAGKTFGLKVLEKEINDEKNNQTRFFVIGKKQSKSTGKDKTMILFSTKNVSGALYNVLGIIARNGINMTKIESRPSKKKIWEVVFFIEVEGHESDSKVASTLKEMNEFCEFVRVLGSYPKKTGISD